MSNRWHDIILWLSQDTPGAESHSRSRRAGTPDAQLLHNTTLLAAKTKIDGTVTTQDHVVVCGAFTGTVTCQGDIVVLKGAQLDGTVDARNLHVYGAFSGHAHVKQTIHVYNQSHIKADFEAKHLVMEEGALFDGTFKPLYAAKIPAL